MSTDLVNWWSLLCVRKGDFMRTPAGVLSCEDLATLVQQFTAKFDECSLVAGDKILIVVDDERVAVSTFVAALFNGLVPVMLTPATPANRVESVQQSIHAKASVVSLGKRQEPWLKSIGHLLVFQPDLVKKSLFTRSVKGAAWVAQGLGLAAKTLQPKLPVNNSDLAYILFTSGTTSAPSGVMISRKNLFANVESITKVLKVGNSSVVFNDMVLAHGDGLVQGPMLCLHSGATLVRAGGFSIDSIETWLEAVRREGVTHFITVPTVWAMIDRYAKYDDYFPQDRVETLSSVAAWLQPALWDRIETRFKRSLISQYGLTETVASALYAGSSVQAGSKYAAGIPVDCEARIQHQPGCKAEEGELQLKGDNVFSGYWNDPVRTSQTFTTDGWMKTGDLATQDSQGCFFITGRLKNIIMSGGFLIRPQEIDEALCKHAAVKSSVTIAWPDTYFGEVPVSVVETDDASCNENALMLHARDVLEPLKLPKRIVMVQSIPRGDAGKPNLSEVQELVQKNLNQIQVSTQNGASLELVLLQVAAKCFRHPVEKLSLQTGPRDIAGWDSFQHIAFLGALEDQFSIRIPASLASGIRDLRTALNAVELCLQEKS